MRTLERADDPLNDPAGAELGRKVVRPVWAELEKETMQRLDAITIEDLCLAAHRAGIPGEYGARLDFTI